MSVLRKRLASRRECSYVLSLDVAEDTDMYMPMASRIAQLALIDILATGFTLRRGNRFRENLKRVKELKDSRFGLNDQQMFEPTFK